jgi:hypothetical protein
VWGYAAARVLIEGLESTGRRLTRERFVAAIEGLAGIETGVTPKIVYGPGRRTGACGAHLAEVDPRRRDLVTIRDWMPINPCGG